jgi:2-hydroxychromene-2-carboxylate isomerase
MSQQFQDQGGAASSNPSALKRWLASKIVPRIVSLERRDKARAAAESKRLAEKRPHKIEYFHQVDDAYSHLAVQLLQPILEAYDVELVPHLVTGPTDKNAPEPELLLDYARYDCELVASRYGLQFPQAAKRPDKQLVNMALCMLAVATEGEFPQLAVTVGDALWQGDEEGLATLGNRLGAASPEEAREKLAAGSALREKLGHYSGAMFYYEGEWYWGVDRLYHLENRLAALGACRGSGQQLLAVRPAIEAGRYKDKHTLTLEYYPSLRSPYTSIIHDRTVDMAADMGVTLSVRPVMPMVMRGVPITMTKGRYIMTDTAREAETLGLLWGKMYDPIGKPVRDGFALYPYAVENNKGNEFISAFLQAAFFRSISTNNRGGLKWVCEEAGLDWSEAKQHIGTPGWEDMLEKNRLAMYEFGLWGVPSYRLLDADKRVVLAVWGQDRLWLVARTIQDLLREAQESN